MTANVTKMLEIHAYEKNIFEKNWTLDRYDMTDMLSQLRQIYSTQSKINSTTLLVTH